MMSKTAFNFAKMIVKSLPEEHVYRFRKAVGLRFPISFGDFRSELNNKVREMAGNVVQGGIFDGMIMLGNDTWSGIAPKLLGVYESELTSHLRDMTKHSPALIVDVGCADGYYLVGLARMLPNTTVVGFEIDEKSRASALANASANKVDARIRLNGKCEFDDLVDLSLQDPELVIIVDCEGGENEIFRNQSSSRLPHASFIIECHDFIEAGTTDNLLRFFDKTHDVTIVYQGGRNPYDLPLLEDWSDDNRWIVISEMRPVKMHWVVATPRTRSK